MYDGPFLHSVRQTHSMGLYKIRRVLGEAITTKALDKHASKEDKKNWGVVACP